jgi:hypothetical protein
MQPIIANEFACHGDTAIDWQLAHGEERALRSDPRAGLAGTPETLPGAHGCQELFDLDFESVSLVRQRAG